MGPRGDDVYVVGGGNAIAHWNGKSWRMTNLGTAYDLRIVSGSGAGDVFAAGEGQNALLHLRGGAWEPLALPSGASSHGLWVTPTQMFTGTNAGALRLDRRSVSCLGPEQTVTTDGTTTVTAAPTAPTWTASTRRSSCVRMPPTTTATGRSTARTRIAPPSPRATPALNDAGGPGQRSSLAIFRRSLSRRSARARSSASSFSRRTLDFFSDSASVRGLAGGVLGALRLVLGARDRLAQIGVGRAQALASALHLVLGGRLGGVLPLNDVELCLDLVLRLARAARLAGRDAGLVEGAALRALHLHERDLHPRR